MNSRAMKHRGNAIALGCSMMALVLLASGCAELKRGLLGDPPSPPPPPPRAKWTQSPDFSPASISKLAVISEDTIRGDSFMTTIEDEFIKAALGKGYKVASRSDVDRVMQEIRFQRSGLTEGDAARLGKMLNVPAVLIVRITGAGVHSRRTGRQINYVDQYEYTSWCDMSARLISVEKAEVLGLSSFSTARLTDRENNRGPAMYDAAVILADALPARISN